MLTPAELAAHLRVSERTVARMVSDGCPSLLVGSRRRFDVAAVTAWAFDRARTCQSERIPTDAGTRRSVSAVDDYIDAFQQVRLRVKPRNFVSSPVK